MTAYAIALFVHIVGALALFAAFGLEGVALLNLRRADTTEQVREWGKIFGLVRRLAPAALGVLLLAGIYMTATTWRAQAWITVALVAMFLLPVLGARNGLRLAAVLRSLAAERGPLSASARAQLSDPSLSLSYQLRLALGVGIVFLMVVKPALLGSLVTIGVALLIGLAMSVPTLRRNPRREVAGETG